MTLPQLTHVQDWVPKSYHKLYEKVVSGKGNKTECIKVMCLECLGYAKKDITNCLSVSCPLYAHRPYQA